MQTTPIRIFKYKQLNYVLYIFKQFHNYYSTLKKEIIQKNLNQNKSNITTST